MIADLPVLVLNQNYEPLNICQARRAINLLLRGKAEVLENNSWEIHTVNGALSLPSVIRLMYAIRRIWLPRKLTRVEVFNRDRYTCQYCGKETKDLTLDHIIPRHRGGEHSWENVVSACIPCNRHKAGRTPKEAGMKLLHPPHIPRSGSFTIPYYYLRSHEEWLKFLGKAADSYLSS